MPSFGMYTAEGVLVGWLHPSGAAVEAGDPVVEIETEKATQEVVAPAAGILHQIASVGARLTEEALLGYILAPGEPLPPPPPALKPASPLRHTPATVAAGAAGAAAGSTAPQFAPPAERFGRIQATPIARRRAAAAGIDLSGLAGSGPDGRIVEADVSDEVLRRERSWQPRMPATVSSEARTFFATFTNPAAKPPSPAADDRGGWQRAWAGNEAEVKQRNDAVVACYRPSLTPDRVGGVPVLDIRPDGWTEGAISAARTIVYVHGGAYTLHSAASSLTSSVPVAAATGLRVLAVDYTPAPAAGFREIIGEVGAVVAGLVGAGHGLAGIALFGDSAGAAIACGAILKLRDEGLGMPGGVVLWSPWADIAENGDSYATLREAELVFCYDRHLKAAAAAYAPPSEHRHPWVSPVYADFTGGFPPTLIQGGTREIFLSNCVRLYRALDAAGQDVTLDLYEGMPHVFQSFAPDLPESLLARRKVADFLASHLGG